MNIKWYFAQCISLIVALRVVPGFAASSTPPLEIEHLLDFVENSSCIFIRNGTEYDSRKAREHIYKKYEYAKRWIDDTEEFIEYTATGSSISGTPYRVRCQGRNRPSAQWLLEELERFRTTQKSGTEPETLTILEFKRK
jgi:hypothetical protein